MTGITASAPLVDLVVPANTVVATYRATLSDGQVQELPAASVTDTASFSFDVAGGSTYTVVTSAHAADGTTIGQPSVSLPLAVPDGPSTITVKVPGTPVLALA